MRGAQPNKDLIVLPSGGQGAHPKFSVVAIPNLASLNNIASDGVLTHKEYMQVSSQEAKLLRICQRDAVFSQSVEYPKLKAAQQREGQPTMPKFVDPGDPPSFQETMWKKGYKCQEDYWLSYVRD